MKTDFDDKNVKEIILANETFCPPIHITRYIDKENSIDGYYLSTKSHGIVFTDLKGSTKFVMRGDSFEVDIYPLNEAKERAHTILRYFEGPLPREDVEGWFNWITEGETNKGDIKVYRKFANLILSGNHAQAYEYIKHQDTFVRDGVTERIWQELSTPTIISTEEDFERGVQGLNEASARVSKMTVKQRKELTNKAMEMRNET